MAEQFENPEAIKLEEETEFDETAKEKISEVADKAAAKSTKAVQKFDKENANLFSK